MSKRYKIFAISLIAGLLAAPALADGKARTPIQGPTPLKPTVTQHCEHGRLSNGHCYIPHAHQPKTTTVRRHVQAPQRVHRQVVRQVAAPSYDFSGFTGGVGANVGLDYYGGGGGVIVVGSGKRFSGVRQHAASRVTFRHRGGGCGGCGKW